MSAETNPDGCPSGEDVQEESTNNTFECSESLSPTTRSSQNPYASQTSGSSFPNVFSLHTGDFVGSDPFASPNMHPSSVTFQTPPMTNTDTVGENEKQMYQNEYPMSENHRTSRRHDLGNTTQYSMFGGASNVHSNEIFIGSEHLLSSDANQPGADVNEKVKVIWGTNIVVKDVIMSFREFIKDFSMAHKKYEDPHCAVFKESERDTEPLYPNLLKQLKETEIGFFNLDASNLRVFPATKNLYKQVIQYPQEIIPIMDMTINEILLELFPDEDFSNTEPLQVRPFNIDKTVNMRELSPSNIDQLISIKGLVIRSSQLIPDMRFAFFKCSVCEYSLTVENIKGKIQEPQRCPSPGCNALYSMILVHNRCVYSDKQTMRIQETPDSVPDGQTPHSVTICVYDTLVDVSRPGDRVEITGIYRVSHIRLSNRNRKIKNVFRTYVDAVHINKSDKKRLKFVSNDTLSSNDMATGSNHDLDDLSSEENEKIKKLIEMSKLPDLYERLSNSIAPSIWKLDIVKKSILLQLFGGVVKNLEKFGNTRFRGDINVLLTGDPSVSKSHLLQYVHRLSSRGIYTSGKGSSAVGLTAYITRDPETSQLVLESGALVLSDGGLCCIDEFDKMSDSTRSVLHEVMEQQTVSVAKAGIITTLNARTSVLAAANPVDSKYNSSKSIVENINLPPTLLSRFDIICLMLDKPDEANDIQLARHILSLHVCNGNRNNNKYGNANNPDGFPSIIDVPMLSRYIQYARQNISPVLGDKAIGTLLDGYVNIRKVNLTNSGGANIGNSKSYTHSTKTISATTRQLESLIRLSEAHARMRLSPTVEEQDVEEAISLVKNAIMSYALDPVTGKVDMDLVNTGKSSSYREQMSALKNRVKEYLLELKTNVVVFSGLCEKIKEESSIQVSEKVIKEVLRELSDDEVVQFFPPIKSGTEIHILR